MAHQTGEVSPDNDCPALSTDHRGGLTETGLKCKMPSPMDFKVVASTIYEHYISQYDPNCFRLD